MTGRYTQKEFEERNGRVITMKLSKLYSWPEFRDNYSGACQVEYLNRIMNAYGVDLRVVAQEVFNIDGSTLVNFMDTVPEAKNLTKGFASGPGLGKDALRAAVLKAKTTGKLELPKDAYAVPAPSEKRSDPVEHKSGNREKVKPDLKPEKNQTADDKADLPQNQEQPDPFDPLEDDDAVFEQMGLSEESQNENEDEESERSVMDVFISYDPDWEEPEERKTLSDEPEIVEVETRNAKTEQPAVVAAVPQKKKKERNMKANEGKSEPILAPTKAAAQPQKTAILNFDMDFQDIGTVLVPILQNLAGVSGHVVLSVIPD